MTRKSAGGPGEDRNPCAPGGEPAPPGHQEPIYVVEEEKLSTLEKVKDIAAIAQAVATVLAILVAGFWFFLQGEHSPKANISHTVTHRLLNDQWAWVHVAVNIVNAGKRPVDVTRGIVRVQKILPLDRLIDQRLKDGQPLIDPGEARVEWPKVADSYERQLSLHIESGESDRLTFEFILPAYVQTVKIYSYFERQKDPPIGWAESSIYDLTGRSKEP